MKLTRTRLIVSGAGLALGMTLVPGAAFAQVTGDDPDATEDIVIAPPPGPEPRSWEPGSSDDTGGTTDPGSFDDAAIGGSVTTAGVAGTAGVSGVSTAPSGLEDLAVTGAEDGNSLAMPALLMLLGTGVALAGRKLRPSLQ